MLELTVIALMENQPTLMRTGRSSRSVPSHGWNGSRRARRADSGETTTVSLDASSGEGWTQYETTQSQNPRRGCRVSWLIQETVVVPSASQTRHCVTQYVGRAPTGTGEAKPRFDSDTKGVPGALGKRLSDCTRLAPTLHDATHQTPRHTSPGTCPLRGRSP